MEFSFLSQFQYLMTPNKQREIQRSNFHIQLQEQLVGDYYQPGLNPFSRLGPILFFILNNGQMFLDTISEKQELLYYSFSFHLEQYQQYTILH